MAQNVYYPYDFETHKNLSHKQLWLIVYYFMDYAVSLQPFQYRTVNTHFDDILYQSTDSVLRKGS